MSQNRDSRSRNAKDADKSDRRSRREARRRSASKNQSNRPTSVIYATIIIGLLSGMLLWRYATISELEYENKQISDREEKLETIKNDLETKIEEINDSDWLKTQAEERINMRDPEKDQIVTLDLSPEVKENRVLKFFKDLLK